MSEPSPVTPEEIHRHRPDLSVETIRRHCRLGRIPGAYKLGEGSRGVWVVPEEQAAAYIESYERHTQTRTPAPPQAPASVPPGTEE